MSFIAKVNDSGSFIATVNESASFDVTLQTQGEFNVTMGVIGPTGPSGVLTADAPLIYDSVLKNLSIDLTDYATQSWVQSQGYLISSDLAPYLLSSEAASTYYPLTNPANYITTAALTGYATESWVNSNYAPLGYNPFDQSLNSNDTPQFTALFTDTIRPQSLNGNLNFTVYNDTGAGIYYTNYFDAFTNRLVFDTDAGGITFPDGTTQTTAAFNFDPTGYATESWVTSQGYLTAPYNPFDQSLNTTDSVVFSGVQSTYGGTEIVYISPTNVFAADFSGGGYPLGTTITASAGLVMTKAGAGITFPDNTIQTTAAVSPDLSGYAQKAVTNTFSANQVIEVTDNTNAALRVTQLGSGEAFRVEDSANPDSTPFVITADGRVGIGTASPTVGLEVASTSDTMFRGKNTFQPAIAGRIAVDVICSSGITANGINVAYAGSGTAVFVSNTGSGASFRVNDEASDTTPFIVDAGGNVGVKTSAPTTDFEVTGNAKFTTANITSAPSLDDSSSLVPTTAWVSSQGYLTSVSPSTVATLFGAAAQSGSLATLNPPLSNQYLYYDGAYLNWGAAPNPFNQNLNTLDSVLFATQHVVSGGTSFPMSSLTGAWQYADSTGWDFASSGGNFTITNGSSSIILNGSTGITFSDATTQTTAFPPTGGTTSQYIDGTGALQTFPSGSAADRLETTVYNNSGATIPKHSLVYINGGHGNDPTIALAKADAEETSRGTFGFTTADISDQSLGTVLQVGVLEDVHFSLSVTEGDLLFLSPTVAGGWTDTQPYAPNHYVAVGTVTRAHPTQGKIQVRIINSNELSELSDVYFPSAPNNGDVFQFSTDSPANGWRARSPVDAGLLTIDSATATYYPLANPAGYISSVPDATDTVKGIVQLTTDTEIRAGQSTTSTPTTQSASLLAQYSALKRKGWNFAVAPSNQSTGTGYGANYLATYGNVTGGASVAGFTRQYFPIYHPNPLARASANFFNGKQAFGQGLYLLNTAATLGYTLISRIGVANSPTAGVVIPENDTTTKWFGWKYVYGSSIKLQVYDGTTYQETDTGYTPTSSAFSQPVYIVCWSDGAGTAYIEITKPDGTIVTASQTGCPTGAATSATSQSWVLQLSGTGTQTGAVNLTALPVCFATDW